MATREQKNKKPVKRKTTSTKKVKDKDINIQQPTSSVDKELLPIVEIGGEEPLTQNQNTTNEPVVSVVHRIRLPRKQTIIISIIIIVTFAGSMFYFHWFGIGLSAQQRAQIELKTTIATVGKLLLLPKDEIPTLAEITDAKKLAAQQLFFTNAKNGDKLLIFQKSSRAIIYSPSRNIIVNVGPIQRPKKSYDVTTTQMQKTPQIASVEVLNGSNQNGIAASTAKIIASLGDNVISVTDAKKSDYKKTIVVDIVHTSASATAANTIAKELNATVTRLLPNGESNSKADVMVILGADASSS